MSLIQRRYRWAALDMQRMLGEKRTKYYLQEPYEKGFVATRKSRHEIVDFIERHIYTSADVGRYRPVKVIVTVASP